MKLPALNERVDVAAESTKRQLVARVEDVQPPATVLISLPSDGVAPYALSRGEAVELSWLSDRGTVLSSGRIVKRVPVGVDALEVEIEKSEIVQRREDVRVPIAIPVEIEQASAHPLECSTLDLSGGGMKVRYSYVLTVGETVELTIFVPDEEQVDAQAIVVRRSDEDEYGLAFTSIDAADRERLIRYVFRTLRERP